LQSRNPHGKGQRKSLLQHLFEIGAASPELLGLAAEKIEEMGPPAVCAFAQLPFRISIEDLPYVVPADTRGVRVDLRFKPIVLTLDHLGRVIVGSAEADRALLPYGFAATQVLGFCRLWGMRSDYYENYLPSITDEGLEDRRLGSAVWEGKKIPAAYKGQVVTSHSFEAELSHRILMEFRIGLRRLMVNYSLLALRELPLDEICGYFLMPAPGRVCAPGAPRPLLESALKQNVMPRYVTHSEMLKALQFEVRDDSRFLRQLFAMNRLASEGEPEIAIVGCVMAIEALLNEYLEPPPVRSLSITPSLSELPIRSLPEPLKQSLRDLAKERNDIVHNGTRGGGASKRHCDANFRPFELGFALYREINLRKWKPRVPR
jgi:hypothetical protein